MCHQKLWWSPASFHALLRADAGLSRASRADWDMSRAPTRCTRQALTRASVPWCHIPLQSDPFVQADPVWPIYPNSVQTACKKKRKSFDQVELWHWPKSQNFQKWPVPLSFSSTFRFWDPFLHLKLENCANCPIPKKLTFAQILIKKSKFSRSIYLAQFFV